MRLIILCVVLTLQFSVLCQEQAKHLLISPPDGGPSISLTALSMERDASKSAYNPTIELKGNVEILTALCGHEVPTRKMMVLRSDEATYHKGSAEIEARGDVRVKFEPLK